MRADGSQRRGSRTQVGHIGGIRMEGRRGKMQRQDTGTKTLKPDKRDELESILTKENCKRPEIQKQKQQLE